MPTKFMRKQMMIVMVELVILITLPLPLHIALHFQSCFLIPPHMMKFKNILLIAFYTNFIIVKIKITNILFNFWRVFNSFVERKEKHEHHTMPNINRFHDAQACIDACLEISKSSFASCFQDCYTADWIMHWDFIIA